MGSVSACFVVHCKLFPFKPTRKSRCSFLTSENIRQNVQDVPGGAYFNGFPTAAAAELWFRSKVTEVQDFMPEDMREVLGLQEHGFDA